MKTRSDGEREHFDRYYGNRPEVIIPLPVTGEPLSRIASRTVPHRTDCAPAPSAHAGMIGTVSSLPVGLEHITQRLACPSAEVRLENGETLLVPLVNLEVVG